MYTITYSLRNDKFNSDKYYDEAAEFTDEVIREACTLFQPVVEGFKSYKSIKRLECGFSQEEAFLELLILGILWKVYSGDSETLEDIPQRLLVKLGEMRNQSGKLKPGIDFLKGIMSTLFLSPDLYDNLNILKPNMPNFKKLLTWLSAAGEFNQEVKRLGAWQKYLETLSDEEVTNILASSITLALWFEECSEEALGKYTPNVERYLNEIRPGRYWREDIIFCGRRRVEYHLNMVGAEIMNRSFRKAFDETDKKVLLLPSCMRIMDESKCKAIFTDGGFHCSRCSKECNVSHLTKEGLENSFDVIIVPHESSISAKTTEKPLIGPNTGVIGVSCVLNLISGGWLLKEMGIPAQCVLLDYCGCKNHWHNEGIPTSLNIERLKALLGGPV